MNAAAGLLLPPPFSAVFSPCRTWRYEWSVLWTAAKRPKLLCMVMLNPSKASEHRTDNTVAKCIRYAKRWGFDGLVVVNLFAFCATHPTEMLAANDPVGADNDKHILAAATRASRVVCAWGPDGRHLERDQHVLALLRASGVELRALHLTKDGCPGHPLYLRGDAEPFLI